MSAFEYQLTRSPRRHSIAIVVRRGEVKVMAPVYVPQLRIEQFVAAKSHWISAKLEQQQLWQGKYRQASKNLANGDTLLYLNQSLMLEIQTGSRGLVTKDQHRLLVSVPRRVKAENHATYVKQKLADWYKAQMVTLLDERVGNYAALLGVEPTAVGVRAYTSRWGSCSSRGKVSFNYLLMMAPLWVIDYVVVHELAHLVHLNHSAAFWALVERFYPDYRVAQQYLKTHGGALRL